MRIAIVREFMVKHAKNDVAISDQIDKEIKTALRDKLGAELVESVDPLYPDDASVPNLKYTFQDAIREIFPATVPEYFAQKSANGELEFAVPGWDVTSTDYLTALSLGKAPLSPKLTLRRTFKSVTHGEGSFGWDLYLGRRGDERIKDWASWVPNAKFDSEQALAQAMNAVNTNGCARKARHDQLPEDAARVAHGRAQGDARERYRCVRESGEHAAAVQARPCLGAGGEQSRLEGRSADIHGGDGRA